MDGLRHTWGLVRAEARRVIAMAVVLLYWGLVSAVTLLVCGGFLLAAGLSLLLLPIGYAVACLWEIVNQARARRVDVRPAAPPRLRVVHRDDPPE